MRAFKFLADSDSWFTKSQNQPHTDYKFVIERNHENNDKFNWLWNQPHSEIMNIMIRNQPHSDDNHESEIEIEIIGEKQSRERHNIEWNADLGGILWCEWWKHIQIILKIW